MNMTRPPYVVLNWTTHYRIVGGRTYRDAIALDRTGARRLVAFPVEVAA